MSEENGKSQWQREMEQWQTRFREQMDEMNRMYIKHNTERLAALATGFLT